MQKHPNILMIMADQLTALALRAYGHPFARTPHLDRLAAEGVVFESAYCNFPLCAPSRAALMSGRLASRVEVYDNAAEFRASVPTRAHGLRALGYRICLAGKCISSARTSCTASGSGSTDIHPADLGWPPDWGQPDERIDWRRHNMASVENGSATRPMPRSRRRSTKA